ncbi:MAG: ribosome-associated translation inhibitor RaiA, partial [Coriobacteriales bacterium]|nr:ribosome-associated translation inhibitor RaiA [Coriobacteriales bacterium]
MEVTVTGRKMSISDPLRSYVEEKIGSSVKVFNITPMRAEVVLHVERNPANPHPAVAEVTLFTKGHIIRSEEAEEDMYAAIDVAAAKVER